MALSNMSFANLPDVLVKVRVGEDMYQRRGGMKYFKKRSKTTRVYDDAWYNIAATIHI